MDDKLVRMLGSVKEKEFLDNFDQIIDKYRTIATATGYYGDLLFKKEHGRMIVFIQLDNTDDESQ